MEGVPGPWFGPLAKLSRSSVSFDSEEESLVNTITLLAIFDRKKPKYNN
jgi:hypothetical protein